MPEVKSNEAIDKTANAARTGIEEANKAARATIDNTMKAAEPIGQTAVEAGGRGAEAAKDVIAKSAGVAAQSLAALTDQLNAVIGLVGPEAEKLARKSSQTIEAVSQANSALIKGAEDASKQWVTFARDRLIENIGALERVARCRSVPDLVAVQSDLIRDNLDQTLEGGRRIAEVYVRASEEAAGRVKAGAGA